MACFTKYSIQKSINHIQVSIKRCTYATGQPRMWPMFVVNMENSAITQTQPRTQRVFGILVKVPAKPPKSFNGLWIKFDPAEMRFPAICARTTVISKLFVAATIGSFGLHGIFETKLLKYVGIYLSIIICSEQDGERDSKRSIKLTTTWKLTTRLHAGRFRLLME